MYARLVPFVVTLATFTLTATIAEADALDCEYPLFTLAQPEDGATFEGKPAAIVVKVNVRSGDGLRRVGIEVDGSQAASRAITDEGDYELSVALDPGTYALEAFVEEDCLGKSHSDSISVTVREPSGAKTRAATAKDQSDPPENAGLAKPAVVSSDEKAPQAADVPTKEDAPKKGCAVSRTPNATIIGLSAFALAVLGAWRLRRART
jgi:hypothetical protein